MPIEFRCPQCQKLLRVPSESAGAKAKCPQCGAIANVPPADSPDVGNDDRPFGATHGTTPGPAANPFGGDNYPTQPPAKPAANEPVNPYSTPASGYSSAAYKPLASGDMIPTAVDVGDVIGHAWEVWKSNLGLLVGITAAVLGANFGLGMVQGGVQEVFRQQGQEGTGAVIAFVIGMFSNFVQL